MKQKLTEEIIKEIQRPSFEVTKEFLNAHTVEFENDQPKIEYIDVESSNDFDIVYLKIVDQPFFLTFYFSKDQSELISISTENSNQIYFTATSTTKTFTELMQMTNLQGIKGWSYDQLRPNGKVIYGFSRISYEPIPNRAYDFDKKLKLLLTDLENDREGIIKITNSADAVISIHHQMYISANKGIHLDVETINRLSKLNLPIDIDQYVYGNEIE